MDGQVKINNCYNRGTVINNSNHGGGILGFISDNHLNNSLELYNCYNTGNITSSGNRGSIVGYESSGKIKTISNNYWITGTATVGRGTTNSNTEATPIDANTLSTYADTLGSDYWTEDTTIINDGYPILKWQLK